MREKPPYRLRDWMAVNFYPLCEPPNGLACRAVNIARYFAGLDYLDFSQQDLIQKEEHEYTLKEAEGVENWVDESSGYKWKYTWDEIEALGEKCPDNLPATFKHFERIGYDHGTLPRDDDAVYYYHQDTARESLKRSATLAGVTFGCLMVCVYALLDAHGFSFASLFASLWSGVKAVTYWTVDVLAPLLFVGAVGWNAGRWGLRWLKGREKRQLTDGEDK